jgi:hypothetical protein
VTVAIPDKEHRPAQKKKLSQWHLVEHKKRTDWRGIQPAPSPYFCHHNHKPIDHDHYLRHQIQISADDK